MHWQDKGFSSDPIKGGGPSNEEKTVLIELLMRKALVIGTGRHAQVWTNQMVKGMEWKSRLLAAQARVQG